MGRRMTINDRISKFIYKERIIPNICRSCRKIQSHANGMTEFAKDNPNYHPRTGSSHTSLKSYIFFDRRNIRNRKQYYDAYYDQTLKRTKYSTIGDIFLIDEIHDDGLCKVTDINNIFKFYWDDDLISINEINNPYDPDDYRDTVFRDNIGRKGITRFSGI